MKSFHLFFIVLIQFILCGCEHNELKSVSSSKSKKLDDKAEWMSTGKRSDEQRFSELKQINHENVKELSLAWYVDLPEGGGQKAAPLVVNDVMYTTAACSHVFAINPETGKTIWHYDPHLDDPVAVKDCFAPINTGLVYSDGKIFIVACNRHLIALDVNSGKELWSVQTTDNYTNSTTTGMPHIANGKIFINNEGNEFGARGYVSAYDENTGKQVWRFYTAPETPNKRRGNQIHHEAVKNWSGNFWKLGGEGTAWDSMAYDPEFNLLYIGVVNSSSLNPQRLNNSIGESLYVSSIVALNADTGKYVWHYHTIPIDAWDFTATHHMILADLVIKGQQRKVIMQAPKNGFFYVFDRKTGEFISAENYVPVNWESGIDKNGRPIINDETRYWLSEKPALVTPGWLGGHSWHSMSFTPEVSLVYFAAQEFDFPYTSDHDFTPKDTAAELDNDISIAVFHNNTPIKNLTKKVTKTNRSTWVPVQQTKVWRLQLPGIWNKGVLSTAGNLVFQGSTAGFFNAFNAKTGEKLWEFATKTRISTAPITYKINDKQYVTVLAGWEGIFPLLTEPLYLDSDPKQVNRSRLLTFKIGGKTTLPTIFDELRYLPNYTDIPTEIKRVKRGHKNFDLYCASCHGKGAIGGGVIPDLRYSGVTSDSVIWKSVVFEGALKSNGMASFSDDLSELDVEDIRQFVVERNKYAESIGDVTRTSH